MPALFLNNAQIVFSSLRFFFLIIDPDKFCLMPFQRQNYQKTSVTSWHFKLHITAKNFIFVTSELPVSSVVFLMQRDGSGKCSCHPGFFQALQSSFFPLCYTWKTYFQTSNAHDSSIMFDTHQLIKISDIQI